MEVKGERRIQPAEDSMQFKSLQPQESRSEQSHISPPHTADFPLWVGMLLTYSALTLHGFHPGTVEGTLLLLQA